MRSRSFLIIWSVVFLNLAFTALAQQTSQPSNNAPNEASASSGAPSASAPMQNFPLGVNDTISVKVLGEPQFDTITDVDETGNITLPFIDEPIPARCRYVKDVRQDIIKALTKYIRNPEVSVRVAERRSRPPVTIYGAVRTPMRVEMLRRAHLLDLISAAGGVTEQAGGTVQIFHTEPPMCDEAETGKEIKQAKMEKASDPTQVPFSVYKLSDLKLGKEEANPAIRPGDIILVAEAPPVYITGAVNAPQGVYLRDKLTLSTALAMVGGIKREAKTSDVRIYRRRADSQEREVIAVNYDNIKKNKRNDVLLEPYDIVEVGEASAFSGKNLGRTLVGIATGGLNSFGAALPTRVLY